MANKRAAKISVVAVVAVIGVSSFLAYLYDQMYDCLNPPMWIKHPRHYGLDDCLKMYAEGTLPDYTQMREDHAKEQAHREQMIESFSEIPEVVSFYDKHGDDANVSVRDDHVSYFAGDSESFHPRMNLHYDEKNELTHLRFYCFNDRGVQYEVAQEDILHYLKNKDCMPKVLPTKSEIKSTMSNQQCANLFDLSWSAWIAHATKIRTDGSQMEPPRKQDIISGSEFFAEFRDTDCRFSVNSWAYLTEDQSIVWDDIPWPELRTYPHEHVESGDSMILEAFPKSNPLNGYYFIHQIKHGEHQYLWDAIQYGNAILDFDEADEFHREFVDTSNKFEMHLPDDPSQIWSMSYSEKKIQNNRNLVEAIVFDSVTPGDAPNIPYVEVSEEMIPIILPLTEREKQFRYQEVTNEDAVKIYKMLDEKGIMFSMGDEKLFLKYLGPFLESGIIENED